MEWLKHSNKSSKQCDICNTPYRFRTIYDPNMPARMPLLYVWDNMLRQFSSWCVRNFLIMLYTFCAIQVPLFWKFIGRIFTYAVDGKLPSPDFDIMQALLYGAYPMRGGDSALFGPSSPFLTKLEVFVNYTFVSGVQYVIAFVVVNLAVFIEHEWVVRDEGYTKMLLRKIGKEPRTKLADLLAQLVQQRENNEAAREVMVNRALEDLQNVPDVPQHEVALRRALENRRLEEFVNERENQEDAANDGGDEDDVDDFDTQDLVELPVREIPEANVRVHDIQDRDHEAPQNFHQAPNIHQAPNFHHAPQEPQGQDPQNSDLDNDDTNINLNVEDESDIEAPEELERRRNVEADELAAAEAANNNGDIFELLGIRFDLWTPILLVVMADFIILVFLFNAYMLPHMLGNFAVLLFAYALRALHMAVAPSLVFLVNYVGWVPRLADLAPENAPARFLVFAAREFVIKPVVETLVHISTLEKVQPPSLWERLVLLIVGYTLICTAIYKFMTTLIAGKKPIMGTPRRIYKVLFEVVATAKVFIIFAIEIVVFPVYCGWLVDFCLTPLLVGDIVVKNQDETTYIVLFTSSFDLTQIPFVRALLYWLWGTGYMLFFALFVGMVRSQILRAGVLFFIRSPEDPNARLIHDALVKPFNLQLLRIYLSAKVYTAFIGIGIGLVTWGLRFVVSPPGEKLVFLPIQTPGLGSLSIVLITALMLIKAKPIIAKYCEMYWIRVFTASCYKLRLSDFILGSPVPQERGYVVYRSFLHQLVGIYAPDYSKPVTYSAAMTLFDSDPTVNAYFVPDGNYVRAPGNDTVSRRFVRELFVPVTKLDQLLTPTPEQEETTHNGYESDSDDEASAEDVYSVVYRPPNFRKRCFALVCMISVFAELLFMVIAMGAVILGRPVLHAFIIVADVVASRSGFQELPSKAFDWALLDVITICIGLQIELAILLNVDYRPNPDVALNFFAAQHRRLVQPGRETVKLAQRVGFVSLSVAAHIALANVIHTVYLKPMEFHWFGYSILTEEHYDIGKHWMGSVLHLAMLTYTFFPVKFAIVLKPEDISWERWLWKSGLGHALGGLLFLLALAPKTKYPMSADDDVNFQIVLLLVVISVRMVTNGYGIWNGITEQIKNEKYVRGTAIENIDPPQD